MQRQQLIVVSNMLKHAEVSGTQAPDPVKACRLQLMVTANASVGALNNMPLMSTVLSKHTAGASCWMTESSSEARLALLLAQQQYCQGLVTPPSLSAHHRSHLHHHRCQYPGRLMMPHQQLDRTLCLAAVSQCWEVLLSLLRLDLLQSPAGKLGSQQEVYQQDVTFCRTRT